MVAIDVLPGLAIGVTAMVLLIVYSASRPHPAVLGRRPGVADAYGDIVRHPDFETISGVLALRGAVDAGRQPHRGESQGRMPDDQVQDATRRTRLANERTYLAWWRTGLTTLAVSFAAGRLVPELSTGPRWPFQVIGVAFAIVGVALIVYGYRRHEEVEAAVARGEYASLPHRASAFFAAVGALLGVATVLLVLLHPT